MRLPILLDCHLSSLKVLVEPIEFRNMIRQLKDIACLGDLLLLLDVPDFILRLHQERLQLLQLGLLQLGALN